MDQALASEKPAASGLRRRADAARNRARILEAAQEAFIEFGADVPLDEIARRAGIGNATVYRHFPDRRALVRGVVLEVMERANSVAVQAYAEESDPFEALSRLVHDSVNWKIGALCPMLSEWTDLGDPEVYATRERLDGSIQAIVSAAQAAGSLRDDVGSDDVMMAVAQLVRPFPGARYESLQPFVHRHLQLLLDGLRAPARTPLPGSPQSLEDVRRECVLASANRRECRS
ncbi:TetR/AcrR family transcriptional regulator [Streptacidiphilus pinicola]|uniref:TetR/AcrR family transcriptional regulator n=1 Tax=Streptacidiphilus pinicola TaxID=2219663 RepID=A0A2X0IC97_9ACTN|nr:TetR/AcrR family transcriptional regulator [Streptacidiphilus pinicola]RAG82584.1 TetR/AcrR family transcriptional regulator [Streptacidiphilus pinicola]